MGACTSQVVQIEKIQQQAAPEGGGALRTPPQAQST
jgi:hypothetical protein